MKNNREKWSNSINPTFANGYSDIYNKYPRYNKQKFQSYATQNTYVETITTNESNRCDLDKKVNNKINEAAKNNFYVRLINYFESNTNNSKIVGYHIVFNKIKKYENNMHY